MLSLPAINNHIKNKVMWQLINSNVSIKESTDKNNTQNIY